MLYSSDVWCPLFYSVIFCPTLDAGWDMTLIMVAALPFIAVSAVFLAKVTTSLTNEAQESYTQVRYRGGPYRSGVEKTRL
jgi:hypothetical protein